MNKKEIKDLIKETKNLTLLYVEDDETIVEHTLIIFKKFFNKIIYAKDGEEGVEKFNENHIDIIISDINMPKQNGLDMLFNIKQIDPNIVSLVTTAHEESVYYQGALDVNVQGYLIKPIKLDMLIKKLLNAIRVKKNYESDMFRMNYLYKANQKLIDMGYQISNENNYEKILEIILNTAKDVSNADGGTLYLYNDKNKTLDFKFALNSSLNIHYGGSNNDDSIKYNLNMFDEENYLNTKNVAVVCASNDKLINISDIYRSSNYDFSGAKEFDQKYLYSTKSMLAIPMRDKDDNLSGVVQLVNKKDSNNKIVSFNSDDEMLIYSMGSQATMMLNNHNKINEFKNIFSDIFVSLEIDESEKNIWAKKIEKIINS